MTDHSARPTSETQAPADASWHAGTPAVVEALGLAEESVRRCAAEIAEAFAATADASGEPLSLGDALSRLGMHESCGGLPSTLAAGATQTLAAMSAGAAEIGTAMREALRELEQVQAGVDRVIRLAEDLRRIGKISSALSVLAAVEGARADSVHSADFRIAGGQIAELAETNGMLCSEVEDKGSAVRWAASGLSSELVKALSCLDDQRVDLDVNHKLIRADLDEYESLIGKRFSEMADLSKKIQADVNVIFRGLQFEDVSTQLIVAMRHQAEDPEDRDPIRPVQQTSMNAGEVELF